MNHKLYKQRQEEILADVAAYGYVPDDAEAALDALLLEVVGEPEGDAEILALKAEYTNKEHSGILAASRIFGRNPS